ncbi:MAG: homocysteine S-methyltransferase family protein [Clostridiales bacterium]|jgi:5-methyltetrahydrofolate--homocysteine methyltransferase|nr:homocysteine S-methyltransferase family protein [Clostridiales bacterium]
MNVKDKLGKGLLFFDGAMGTMLQRENLKLGELPELLNLNNPDVVFDIHCQYLNAGSDIISANTFGANSIKFHTRLEEVVHQGIAIAKRAICHVGGKQRYVALDVGSLGRLLKPLGTLAFSEAYGLFQEIMIAGEKAGADLVLIETMSDTYEAKAAILAAKENTALPVFCTMTFDESKKTLTGGSITAMVALLEGLSVDCLGINCGLGPKQISILFDDLKQYASIPIMLQPNAGMPVYKDGKTAYDVSEQEFADVMRRLAQKGAAVLGGCCGTTLRHIALMIEQCQGIIPEPILPKSSTLISSYSDVVELKDAPIIIGERINPTGKKKFKEALINNDINYILKEALSQKECGAHILDVNVGLPEINEKQMMVEAVEQIQAVTNLPLQIDSADPAVIEAALRIYNGKALVNSVNGKQEIMRGVFPLVKKYGGVVVGLTLDEKGIPSTAQGRLEIAKRIINTAKEYGIDKKNIIIDTLTMTVSAEQGEAFKTLEALRTVKRVLNVKTVLGVSNVSFGLPRREIINATFFALALQSGLNACIINPCSEDMMRAYRAYRVLACYDEQCADYINAYANAAASPAPLQTAKADTLSDIVQKGLRDLAADAAREQLKSHTPMEIVEGQLIPALDIVGKGFEAGRVFLPQLIMSAETVKNAFEVLKERMRQSGDQAHQSKGKIVLATVKGDIHDIGKNIVKVILENYGYEVIDLGKDVDVDLVVKTVEEENIQLVGLSALMTTTVVSMEQTIKALKNASFTQCKIMVGGAVLTKEYADKVGADFYAKDAMDSVYYAQEVFQNTQ